MESLPSPMDLLGLGLVWLGLGLVWPRARLMESLPFPMDLLGLGLVWLGLAAGTFDGIIAFSAGSAWFGVGNRRRHESDDNSTVRRTCPQTIDHHQVIA